MKKILLVVVLLFLTSFSVLAQQKETHTLATKNQVWLFNQFNRLLNIELNRYPEDNNNVLVKIICGDVFYGQSTEEKFDELKQKVNSWLWDNSFDTTIADDVLGNEKLDLYVYILGDSTAVRKEFALIYFWETKERIHVFYSVCELQDI